MRAKQTRDADVIIIGGGPAGMTMAALLASYGIDVLCIDKDDPGNMLGGQYDARTTAISYGSQRVIAAAGAWDEALLKPCAIKDIHIMDGGSPTLLEFLADDVDAPAFGWIVDNHALRQSLYNRLSTLTNAQHIATATVTDFVVDAQSASVQLNDGTLYRAALIIGADGRNSFTRQWMDIPVRSWSYNQQAIICTVTHTMPHAHKATEHFLDEGPFALLPINDDETGKHRSALVWSEEIGKRSMMNWNDETFLTALNARLPDFYGVATAVSKRFTYPLSFTHAYSYIGSRMALIADAAHAIHPIAGQGLNLGLRDIAVLAELLVAAKDKGSDLGAPDLLEQYQRQRRFDNVLMAGATDTLNRLFSNKSKLLGLARKAGLRAVQKLPAAQKFFMRQAMGAPASHLPRLIREGKLR